jgi:hypothetical protein
VSDVPKPGCCGEYPECSHVLAWHERTFPGPVMKPAPAPEARCERCGNGPDSFLHDRINCTAYHPFAPAPEAHDVHNEACGCVQMPTPAPATHDDPKPEARLTREDAEVLIASPGLWGRSEQGPMAYALLAHFDATEAAIAAQRKEIERLAGLLERWKAVADKGYTDDESGDGSTLLQETIEIENDTRAALLERRKP